MLTRIAASDAASGRVSVAIRSGRVLVLVALCVAALVAAAVLHGLDRETAAAWFTGMGEALLFAVLGAAAGEVLGAKQAADVLSQAHRRPPAGER